MEDLSKNKCGGTTNDTSLFDSFEKMQADISELFELGEMVDENVWIYKYLCMVDYFW